MPSKFSESQNFNPTLAPGLSDEARKAVNAAFDAISTWRTETVNTSEKNFDRVIDKMAAAARALGWPEEIADYTRAQMQGIIKMQIQMIDQIMDAWEEQIKSPSSSSAILLKLKSLPSLSAAGGWPGSVTSQMATFNPLGIYIQMAQQWQKACADTMAFWTKAGESNSWRARS
jgi:hypothetical protein